MRILFIFSGCLLLTACMVGPNFHTPTAPQTKRYTRLPLPKKSGQQCIAAGKDIPAEWWTLFHSKPLNSYIAQGIKHSPNLQAAKAALRQAQENWREQIGNLLLPAVNGQFSANRQRGFSALPGGITANRAEFSLYNANISVTYLLDVFGGSRRQVEAYGAQVDFQQFELEAAYLTLTSNIVTTYISIASFQSQIDSTKEIIRLQENQLSIVKKQYQIGGTSNADVLTQETQVAQTRALLPPLERNLAQSQDALAALVGEFPSQLQIPTINLSALTLPKQLPLSLPSNLVRQRPDIRAQEALLHSASAQIGVATAQLLPQFPLTGTIGQNTADITTLFNAQNNFWFIGASALQPIFHGGALLAQRRAAIAAFEQAGAVYRQTVLLAFQNVADALESIKHDADAVQAQRKAEISALRAMNITQKQFQLGGVSYLILLNAQRQYQQIRINRIQAEAAQYSDTAALFLALGGGWWNRETHT